MKRKVIYHHSLIRNFKRFGAPVTITGTLCGRMQTVEDGMNVSESETVTCKLCLRLLKRKERAGVSDVER